MVLRSSLVGPLVGLCLACGGPLPATPPPAAAPVAPVAPVASSDLPPTSKPGASPADVSSAGVAHPTDVPPADAAPTVVTPEPVTPRPPALSSTPIALSGYPLARLRVAANPVLALDHRIPQTSLAQLGVRAYHSYTATTPQVWLLVFEFADQARLLSALPKIVALVGKDDAAPFYRTTSYTGAWLLVAGFPGEKPVSPEMEAARTEFTSRWAGEE